MTHLESCSALAAEPGPCDCLDAHVVGLELAVEDFARRLTAAQDAGVSNAVLLPRMMLAFRRAFGEPPPGFSLPPGMGWPS